MTLLTDCVTTNSRPRRSPADGQHQASVTNMASPTEDVEATNVAGDSTPCCLSSASPSASRVGVEDVYDLPTGNGSSVTPSVELDATPSVTRSERSSPPVLSFSVAAIMAKSTSPPTSRTQHQSAVELNHNNHRHRRRRADCGPLSPVSPLAASPRRSSVFTVDGILNGVRRTSSRPASTDDGDDSSCSAADDSESNRSSPGVARSFPPSSAVVPTANASVTARQGLPFLHPPGSTAIDVACKWPPAGCSYPWQYVNPPSKSYFLKLQ